MRHSFDPARIVLRNAADGSIIRTLALGNQGREPQDQAHVEWMQFVPNHDLIALEVYGWSVREQRYYARLRFLRISDGAVVRTLENVLLGDFSADGTLTVAVQSRSSGNSVRLLQLLRTSDGAVVREIPLSTGETVGALTLSPDARLIAMQLSRRTGNAERILLQVRRVADNKTVFELEDNDWSDILKFSADGTRLFAVGRTVRVWRTSDFALLRTFQTPNVADIIRAMSANGRLVATHNTHEFAIRLWRVDDGQLLQTCTDESRLVPRWLMFSPTGRQLAYLRGDDTLVVARNPFAVEGDIDGDGCVNNADLLLVLFNFGNAGGTGDANDDDIVNNADLLIVLFNFGYGC